MIMFMKLIISSMCMRSSYYSNWKMINVDNTYETEVGFMCGDVVSKEEFVDYIERHGDIRTIHKLDIMNALSDGYLAGDFLNVSLEDLKKDSRLNEIIMGFENDEPIPYPVFEITRSGELVCCDGRHRLLVAMKMNIISKIIAIPMIPSNDDSSNEISIFRKKYIDN